MSTLIQISPSPPYKVYTALLTQSGGYDTQGQTSGSLVIGTTYRIIDSGGDFTNVGAPNNEGDTYFVATGTTPNNWGTGSLEYNTGAPVVIVLENTIGNIWFEYYDDGGTYDIKSDALFTDNKTTFSINLMGEDVGTGYFCLGSIMNNSTNRITTGSVGDGEIDDVLLYTTPIEIRVYN